MRFPLCIFPLLLCLWVACKTPPVPPPLPPAPSPEAPAEAPRYRLDFKRVHGLGLRRAALYYTLEAENPRARTLGIEPRAWKVFLNGEELSCEAAVLDVLEAAAGTADLNLTLSLPEDGGDFDEYRCDLEARLAGPEGDIILREEAVFPRIRAPEFTIAAIAIMKAELVNTRFRVDLRIDNPNIFPVALSSLNYELYGKGRFWARGRERNILEIPPKGQAAARLFLEMNFTNMRRELLDEVIALGTVPYRFTGEALVDTGLSLLTSFRMTFDRQGVSAVVD
jgi:LEA14-like dessication related protein